MANLIDHHIDFLKRYLLLEDSAFNTDQFLEKLRGVMELIRRGAYEGERSAAQGALTRLLDRAKQEVARMREPNSGVTHEQVNRFTRLLDQISSNTEQARPQTNRPPPPKEPLFKVGQWIVITNRTPPNCGKIIRVMNFGERGILYNIEIDQEKIGAKQDDVRKATQEEVDDAVRNVIRNRQKSTERPKEEQPNTADSDLDILMMAHFVNEAMHSDKIYGVVKRTGKIYTFWGGNHKALATKHHPRESDAQHQYDTKLAKGYSEMDAREFAQAKPWVTVALKARFSKLGESVQYPRDEISFSWRFLNSIIS